MLGHLRIEQRQLGAVTLANRKATGLLAYLLVESDHAHSREFLQGLLWPDLPTAAAQNNLRVTWAYLQKALRTGDSGVQPHLVGDRLTLRFNRRSDHELDVTRFRALVEVCRTHPHADPHDCAECAARLAEAVALVRGDFLDDFSLGDCAQFDEWLRMQRAYFHVQVVAAMEQLATFYERAGRLPEAERTVRRLLAADPLREAAYRQLMRVLARAERRSAALEVYAACRRVLAAELGLAPAVETVMLAEQIRARAGVESRPAHTPLPPVRTRFFGRQPECTRLVDLLSRRMARLVTLSGPGGVGKSRLALEVARRLADAFPHGICFVELAGVAQGSAVDDAVAAALHLPAGGPLVCRCHCGFPARQEHAPGTGQLRALGASVRTPLPGARPRRPGAGGAGHEPCSAAPRRGARGAAGAVCDAGDYGSAWCRATHSRGAAEL